MKSLVVEDEFVARRILQHFLSTHGECDVAANGREALEAFASALNEHRPYDLVCLDLMLPEIDGQEVLREIRELESTHGVAIGEGAKVIMTTSLNDRRNVINAFKSGCESYLVKPIDKTKVAGELQKLGLL